MIRACKLAMVVSRMAAMAGAAWGIGASGGGARALAQQDVPRFWAETHAEGVRGPLLIDPRVVRMVRFDVGMGRDQRWFCQPIDGAATAEEIAAIIRNRGLTEGNVAIMLARFGASHPTDECNRDVVALVHAELDGLAPGTVPEYARYSTPWKRFGIAESKAWFAAFATRYEQLRAESAGTLPPPTRFLFDTEVDGGLTYCGRTACIPDCQWGFADVFEAMQADPRWATEAVPGMFGPNGQEWTMAQAYAAAGSPGYDACWWLFGSQLNQTFGNWYQTIALQSVSGAMWQGAYRIAEQTWGAKSGNFIYWSADGVTDLTRPPFERREWDIYDPAYTIYEWQSAPAKVLEGLHMPVLYGAAPAPGSTFEEASARTARYQLESIQNSFGGVPGSDIVPFLALHASSPQFKDANRNTLAICRAKGVHEFEVFAPETGAAALRGWLAWSDLVGQVYGSRVKDASPLVGQHLAGSVESLYRSDFDDAFVVESEGEVADIQVIFRATPEFGRPTRFRVDVEAWVDRPENVVCKVFLHDQSAIGAGWVQSGQMALVGEPRLLKSFTAPLGNGWTGGRFFDAGGYVTARLVFESIDGAGFVASVDAAQLVGLDPCPADVDRDGYTTLADLDALLARMSQGAECDELDRCRSDLTGDRAVNADDVYAFIAEYFAGCGVDEPTYSARGDETMPPEAGFVTR